MQLPTWGTAVAAGVLNIVLLLFMMYLVVRNRILSVRRTNYYRLAILLTILMIVAECATLYAENGAFILYPAHVLANTVGFALSPLLPVILAAVCSDSGQGQPLFLLPLLGNMLVAALSPWTGWIFSVSPGNAYARGPLFRVYVCTYIYSFILFLAANYKQALRYSPASRRFFGALTALLACGTTVQVIWPDLHTTWHCATIVLLLYYLFQRELQFQYDGLTGLLNREAFQRRLEELRCAPQVSVFMFDVDSFKIVNDSFGHAAGDTCLRQVADAIMASFAPLGECYRIGGDEFCVLGEGTSPELAACCCAALEQRLKKMQEGDTRIPGVSFGSATVSGAELEHGWHAADQRLYCCKQQRHAATAQGAEG